METRKVQRTGYSTLAVSLPRSWVRAVTLKPGDTVTLSEEDDGSLRLFVGHRTHAEGERGCIINADLCDEPGLLSRVLIGDYIVGHERLVVASKKSLRPEHLEEIRNSTQRLIGVSIVEQTLSQVTLQSFIDPAKFPVSGLIRRLHVIMVTMLDAISRSLSESEPRLAREVINMENEADRLYRLVVRQLLLAARDRELMKNIGIDSPLHIVGNRVIAKTLEEAADYLEETAKQILELQARNALTEDVSKMIAALAASVKAVAESSIEAFFRRDIKRASKSVWAAESVRTVGEQQIHEILSDVKDAQQATALRLVVWNLVQVARLQKIVSEVAINRALEETSQISTLTVEQVTS